MHSIHSHSRSDTNFYVQCVSPKTGLIVLSKVNVSSLWLPWSVIQLEQSKNKPLEVQHYSTQFYYVRCTTDDSLCSPTCCVIHILQFPCKYAVHVKNKRCFRTVNLVPRSFVTGRQEGIDSGAGQCLEQPYYIVNAYTACLQKCYTLLLTGFQNFALA